MLQNLRASRTEFNVGDLIKFNNHPFRGWAYVSELRKLENNNILMFVTSLEINNRTSIIDPSSVSWYVSNKAVIHVPIIKTI